MASEVVYDALDFQQGGMAEWLCSGLQSRVRRFNSDSRLHFSARMVKLADTKDLKSFAARRAGSSPAPGTSA